MDLKLKRIYEPPGPADGFRVLVDGLWPRGISKQRAQLDLWINNIAPTTELRQWFNHQPERWELFKKRYFRQLDSQPDAVRTLTEMAAPGRVTLLYAAKDPKRNNAVALKAYLEAHSPL